MHRLEHDKTFRGLSGAVNFNRMCKAYHDIAKRLEEDGITTHGINTELYTRVELPNRDSIKLNITPISEFNIQYNSVIQLKDTVWVEIEALDISLTVDLNNYKKVFNPQSRMIKSIAENISALKQFKMTLQDKLNLAMTMELT